MTTPLVTEIRRLLEPVTPDPFIADLERPRPRRATPVVIPVTVEDE